MLGGLDFSNLSIRINDAIICYGAFIQSIVDFLIISFCIFMMVKLFEKLKHEEPVQEEVKKSEEVVLLEEIRDLLKKKK